MTTIEDLKALIEERDALLEALKRVRDRICLITADHKLGGDKNVIAAHQIIRAAIAKATLRKAGGE